MSSGDTARIFRSLFVPVIPTNQCQTYREFLHHASATIVANFSSVLSCYCPCNCKRKFFQYRFVKSICPPHPGKPLFLYAVVISLIGECFSLLFSKTVPYSFKISFVKRWSYWQIPFSVIPAWSSNSSYRHPVQIIRKQSNTFVWDIIPILFPTNLCVPQHD